MRRPTSQKVENQLLQVQELTVRYEDMSLYSTSGSDYTVLIGESVSAVVSVCYLDDSATTFTPVAAATASLVSTTDDRGNVIANSGIKLTALTPPLAAHDSLVVKYITTN